MKYLFVQLKNNFALKKISLQNLLGISTEEQDNQNAIIEEYFQNKQHTDVETCQFLLKLINQFNTHEAKDKLFALLSIFTSRLSLDEAKKIIQEISQSKESIQGKVKFFSLVYKSSNDNELKKILIIKSIQFIQKQARISIFSNFVQNFDTLINELSFNNNQYIQIYIKLINYLERHLVYKKLWKHYIVRCLLNITAANSQSKQVSSLISKLLSTQDFNQQTYLLLKQQNIKNNQFYSFLECLLQGNFQKYNTLNKQLLQRNKISTSELQRRIKVQALPRILSGIKNASYGQIAQILKVQKNDIEGYIIEGIQQGLLKAKIDQFQQNIIINSVNFRTLKQNQRASLQKNLTSLSNRLNQLSLY